MFLLELKGPVTIGSLHTLERHHYGLSVAAQILIRFELEIAVLLEGVVVIPDPQEAPSLLVSEMTVHGPLPVGILLELLPALGGLDPHIWLGYPSKQDSAENDENHPKCDFPLPPGTRGARFSLRVA